mgnify:FL=1
MTDYAQAVNRKPMSSSKGKISTFFSAFATSISHTRNSVSSGAKTILNRKRVGYFLFIAVILLAVGTGLRFVYAQVMSAKGTQSSTIPDAVTVPIEREFSFLVYDKDKKLSEAVRYSITSAQLTKQIIIKGQKATAIKGRTFLIVNLKLINDFDKSLFLNTRNYIRVQPKGTSDKLAPEIHNDTVEAQPLSTKLTRIGLPVDENIKEFTLLVGELDGYKEEIPIKFP